MPIQTSTQVRTVQTTDMGVLRNIATDLLYPAVKMQEGRVLVDVNLLQSCVRVSVERQEVTTRTFREHKPTMIATEFTMIAMGVFVPVAVSNGLGRGESNATLMGFSIYAIGVGVTGLIMLIADRARTFDKTEVAEQLIHHPTSPFVCEQKPVTEAEVLLRFPDGSSIWETTGLDGRAIFPEERVQPLLRRNQGRFRPWINGQPYPDVTLPP
jgi:hypothetical protein